MTVDQMQEGVMYDVKLSEVTERPGQPAGHTMELLGETLTVADIFGTKSKGGGFHNWEADATNTPAKTAAALLGFEGAMRRKMDKRIAKTPASSASFARQLKEGV